MNRREMLGASLSLVGATMSAIEEAGLGKSVDAVRMAEKSAKARDLIIPDCKHPTRRAACEADDKLWLRTYCQDVFYNPFTKHQEKIIADCEEALRYGSQKCKAAPRGDGKSSIVKYLALKYSLTRQVRFPLIVAATGSKAKDSLESLKRRMASGMTIRERTVDGVKRKKCEPRTTLGEDYPLECGTAAYINPWPSRARNLTANGQRVIFSEWGANCIILPTWEDIEPLGPIILALGITSDELQGCNIYDQRPDFVMLDDLDSRDSLAAADGVIAGKIEEAIDKTIAGLGGQSRRLGKFMLCTITSRASAAYKYSDPLQKQWFGERISAIIKWPTRADLWEEYIELRKSGTSTVKDGEPIDPFGREAFRLYLVNRAEMDTGAVLANPYNFEPDLLEDGTQKHVSALQRCYDYIADNGLTSFLTEHQNDPPAESGPVESGITPAKIQKQLNGLARGAVPDGCIAITCGIDVGKYRLHWVVRAWMPDGTGHTIGYGTHTVYGTTRGTDDGVDVSVIRALAELVAILREGDWHTEGEIKKIDLILVDAGYRTDAVYSACQSLGQGIMPVMGFGKSSGCAKVSFSEVQRATADRKPGDGYFLSRKGKTWLVAADTDRWKAWEHDRWMTSGDQPGSMHLWGEPSADSRFSSDEKDHRQYAEQICGEVEVEEIVKGALKRFWKAKGDNHFLDASYYCDVAAAMKEVPMAGSKTKTKRAAPQDRPSLQQLAGRKSG